LAGIASPFGIACVPSRILVPVEATATAAHVRASATLLRLGMASELVAATAFIAAVLALHRPLRGVDQGLARAMVILFAVSVPITYLNVLNPVAALILVHGAPFLSVFTPPQLDALVLLFMDLHDQGLVLAQVFWGLWLFPFGILVVLSGFIPRVFGVFLLINGSAYVVLSATALLAPKASSVVRPFALSALLGELAIILWLLMVGARPLSETAPAS
jgi:hypothetical protein